jgi:hypothetical protein
MKTPSRMILRSESMRLFVNGTTIEASEAGSKLADSYLIALQYITALGLEEQRRFQADTS